MQTGRLGAALVTQNTDTTIYSAAGGLEYGMATVVITNRGTSNTLVSLALSDSETPNNTEYLEFEFELLPGGVLERSGIVVGGGQFLVAKATTGDVNCVVYGVEVENAISTTGGSTTVGDTGLETGGGGGDTGGGGGGTATYSLQATPTSVTNGGSFSVTLTTVNVGGGTSVTYDITGVNSSDINGVPTTGTFVISNNTATANFLCTSTNTEVFTLSLRNGEDSVNVQFN